jgi:hypothetical protein
MEISEFFGENMRRKKFSGYREKLLLFNIADVLPKIWHLTIVCIKMWLQA